MSAPPSAPTNAELNNALKSLYTDIDAWYLVVMGCLVFFMQAGFALLEAGSVRAKNTKNILMKNLLDACIGAILWWAIGYGLAVSSHRAHAAPAPPRHPRSSATAAAPWRSWLALNPPPSPLPCAV